MYFNLFNVTLNLLLLLVILLIVGALLSFLAGAVQQTSEIITIFAPVICWHSSLAPTSFCRLFVPSLGSNGGEAQTVIQETAAAVLDRFTQDARNTGTITPIDMASIRLAVDDMVTLIEGRAYESGDVIAKELGTLSELIANAAKSMTEVRTKVDLGVDRVLAKSALIMSRSMGFNYPMSAQDVNHGQDQALCAITEGSTRGCAPLSRSTSPSVFLALQQASSLFTSILDEFMPLVEKAKADASKMEECLRRIQIMLVQEKILATNEDSRLSTAILVFLKVKERGNRGESIETLFLARRDILAYIYAVNELLTQLSTDIREIQAVIASASNPSEGWEDDFLAVVSAGTHRMRLNKVMQRNAIDTNDQSTLPSATAPVPNLDL
ncbi:hypothetical protein SCHPADRAFT_895568 [Schizopora paradoxa]|uniref:Uncharacterized protein n=1 Tax=Schizopora paradoxa TaxID=27342 RepID=A0A0H2RN67_9AGAM|nr:hypothetical protein SCHPADRAFT_895568 [Schizopora paradoxa]